MNIKSFEKIVNDRTVRFNDTRFNKNVARVIKNKRIQNNQTQSDIAEGICSISYISKIESGKCPPDNFYVREIMTRMGISLDEVMVSEFSRELEDVVKAIYYEDKNSNVKLLELTCNSDILGAKLVQLAGKLYLDEDTDSLIQYINAYKGDLSDYELMIYMYLIAVYESKQLKYIKAINYLHILLELDDGDDYLYFLIHLLMSEAHLYVGNYVESMYYIDMCEKLLQGKYEIHNISKVSSLKIELLLYTDKLKLAKKEFSRFNHPTKVHLEARYYFLKGFIDYLSKNETKAIHSFLMSQQKLFDQSLLFVVLCYIQAGNVRKAKEYAEILKESCKEPIFYSLAEYFLVRAKDNLYEQREYINNNLLHKMKRVQYAYFFDQVTEDLIRFHRVNSRFKAVDELRSKLSDKK